jgi:hypothetical protein
VELGLEDLMLMYWLCLDRMVMIYDFGYKYCCTMLDWPGGIYG